MRIERLNRKRDQDERLRSLKGGWGVRLVQAGGNAHQQTGETSGRRWGCRDVGGHSVDFAPGLINDAQLTMPTPGRRLNRRTSLRSTASD